MNASKGILQTCPKHPFGAKDKLVAFWQRSTLHNFSYDSQIHTTVIPKFTDEKGYKRGQTKGQTCDIATFSGTIC